VAGPRERTRWRRLGVGMDRTRWSLPHDVKATWQIVSTSQTTAAASNVQQDVAQIRLDGHDPFIAAVPLRLLRAPSTGDSASPPVTQFGCYIPSKLQIVDLIAITQKKFNWCLVTPTMHLELLKEVRAARQRDDGQREYDARGRALSMTCLWAMQLRQIAPIDGPQDDPPIVGKSGLTLAGRGVANGGI
jgi:hypothetical protein